MNKNIKNVLIVLLTAFITFSFSKGKVDKPMADSVELTPFSSSKSVKMTARVLTAEEIKEYLPSELDHRDLSIVAMTIDNASPYQYELKKEFVDLALIGKKEIMHGVRLSGIPRSIAFKIAGFFFWPVAVVGSIDSFATLQVQNKFRDKLHASTIKKEGEILLPYSKVHRYLYLPGKETPSSFALKLLNSRTLKHENYNVEITSRYVATT